MNDGAEREKERDWNVDNFPQYQHRLYRLPIEGYCSNVGWVRRRGAKCHLPFTTSNEAPA
jgi:hypothetical protein